MLVSEFNVYLVTGKNATGRITFRKEIVAPTLGMALVAARQIAQQNGSVIDPSSFVGAFKIDNGRPVVLTVAYPEQQWRGEIDETKVAENLAEIAQDIEGQY